ncbi:MAG TPA: DUF4230 domain-containing protein [Gemmatimonadaceae bacterium]|nr:DUF4230 domain-containing protein [Gemmatimonadaceae bacterium]
MRRWAVAGIAAVLGAALAIAADLRIRRAVAGRLSGETVTHALVTERVEAVAKLVASEQTIRDVVVYENTWYGSTKRSLVVVTGRVLAGIDLKRGTSVRIDSAARRIEITIPPAELLAVDIVELRTYDEQRGWWNPFRPQDRDAVYRLTRGKLAEAARATGLERKAEASAKTMLETMFSVDGWVARVEVRPVLAPQG